MNKVLGNTKIILADGGSTYLGHQKISKMKQKSKKLPKTSLFNTDLKTCISYHSDSNDK